MDDKKVRECLDSLALMSWELKLALDELAATGKVSETIRDRLDKCLDRVLSACRPW